VAITRLKNACDRGTLNI